MSTRKMIPGLAHKYAWATDEAKFFEAIDASGGWPVGYQYVGFEHTDERLAGFCNTRTNTGWWTVVASADDYYLWKLSPQALQRIADAVRNAIRVPAVDAQRINIRNSLGNLATIAAAEKGGAS